MATKRVERRLTAILAADVVGYSRLTSMDEEGTHVQLKEHLRVLVDPKISEYRGRVVKNTGDGMLAEFGSVVDAVRCALDVQRGMVERNANVPQEKWIEFRIGINVGDIIIDRGDIFGDGVNVAARLEGLAEPGGICVSALVREYAQGKLDINFEDAGEQQLKNIAQLVRVYKLRLRDVDLSSTAPPGRHGRPRLSIVVLPFANLGGDKEQGDFVDAITENLTTDLSRLPDFFVVACKTAFAYKGKAVDARQVGRELGVRYVLEGSVQSSTDRLRRERAAHRRRIRRTSLGRAIRQAAHGPLRHARRDHSAARTGYGPPADGSRNAACATREANGIGFDRPRPARAHGFLSETVSQRSTRSAWHI